MNAKCVLALTIIYQHQGLIAGFDAQACTCGVAINAMTGRGFDDRAVN